MENQLVELIRNLESSIKKKEAEAFLIYKSEGYSIKWKDEVKELSPLKMMLNGYFNLYINIEW